MRKIITWLGRLFVALLLSALVVGAFGAPDSAAVAMQNDVGTTLSVSDVLPQEVAPDTSEPNVSNGTGLASSDGASGASWLFAALGIIALAAGLGGVTAVRRSR